MVSKFYLMADDPYPGENQTLEPPAIKKNKLYCWSQWINLILTKHTKQPTE